MSLKEGVRPLPWCKGKYPYEKECWAASMGRILIQADCDGCDLLKIDYAVKFTKGE